jgi:hypothetical protein
MYGCPAKKECVMTLADVRYSREEFARRGTEIYERDIRPKVEADNYGKVVAIDIETGEYAIGDTILEAAHSIRDRKPDAQLWGVRVGHRAMHRLGGRK